MSATLTLRVRNWKSFQHYKDRSPAWIKLHKSLLDDYEFQTLPIASRALAPMLWLLASETEGGEIQTCMEKLSFRLRMSQTLLVESLRPLVKSDFIEVVQDASGLLAQPGRQASLEKRREENIKQEREEKNPSPPDGGGVIVEYETSIPKSEPDTAFVYSAYPRKVAKVEAIKAIEAACKRLQAGQMDGREMTRGDALKFLEVRCKQFGISPAGKRGTFTPHPATWFNRGSYLDDEQEWWREESNGNGKGTSAAGQRVERIKQTAARAADLLADKAGLVRGDDAGDDRRGADAVGGSTLRLSK